MRTLKIFLVLAFVVLAAAGSASAARPKGTVTVPNSSGGEPVVALPPVAAQLAKNIAKASFARKYPAVWTYLHPSYQEAVSQAHWQRCQGAHPAAPRSVKVTRVDIATFSQLPTSLPLLGKQKIEEIQLQVQFRSPAASGSQYAVEYTFWLKQGNTWHAVWLPDEYSAYKTGKCYITPQGPPLY
jgi:hypothetical protein